MSFMTILSQFRTYLLGFVGLNTKEPRDRNTMMKHILKTRGFLSPVNCNLETI